MLLDAIGQRLQSERVGNMAAAFANHASDVVLTVAEIADQCAVAFSFFERIEIGALHILDDRKLQRLRVAGLDDDNRNLVQAGTLRRPPAALAGDDFVGVSDTARWPHNDGLDNAALAQRRGEFIKLGAGKSTARIARVWLQRTRRDFSLAARTLDRAFGADIAHQRGKSASQSRSSRFLRHRRISHPFGHACILVIPTPNSFSRWITSVASFK